MKPTDEQTKELWEWCGCQIVEIRETSHLNSKLKIVFPDGITFFVDSLLQLVDLNNLFQYAVLKLDMPVMLSTFNGETEVILPSYFPDAEDLMSEPLSVTDKDPALALFWAIYKVLSQQLFLKLFSFFPMIGFFPAVSHKF